MENATNGTFTIVVVCVVVYTQHRQDRYTLDNTASQTAVFLETEIGYLDEYALLEEK